MPPLHNWDYFIWFWENSLKLKGVYGHIYPEKHITYFDAQVYCGAHL